MKRIGGKQDEIPGHRAKLDKDTGDIVPHSNMQEAHGQRLKTTFLDVENKAEPKKAAPSDAMKRGQRKRGVPDKKSKY